MEKNKRLIIIMDNFRFYVFEVIVDFNTKWACSKYNLNELKQFLETYKSFDDENYSLQFWTYDEEVYNLIQTDKIQDIIDYCNKSK